MGKRKELEALISLAGKVDPSLQRALLQASKQIKKTGKTITGQTGMMAKSMGVLKSVGAGALAGVAALGATAIVAFTNAAKAGINLASDLEEVQNVVDVTFEANSKTIDAWAKTTLNAFGMSELKAKEYSSSLGSMLKASRLSSDQTLIMSQNLTSLIGDFASFKNLEGDEAFSTIMSLMSGETEPGKKYGIDMSVTNLEEFAKLAGYKAKFTDMSQAEKQLVRYNYLLQATADAQGDFERTQDSFANQKKLVVETFNQMSAQIMQNAMPELTQITSALIDFMNDFDTGPLVDFITQLGDAAVGLLPVVLQLIPLLTQTLSTLVPFITQLASMLAPALNEIFTELFAALQPLIEPLLELVTMLLPPLIMIITAILKALAPVLEFIVVFVKKLVEYLMPGIEKIAENVQWLADIFKKAFSWLARWSFTGKTDGAGLDEYAKGGFASRPSIFGEAGLEAAIPIKPGNSRSLALLNRTAELLGIREGTTAEAAVGAAGFTLIYNPTINGTSKSEIEPVLRSHYYDIKEMMEDAQFRQERLEF